MITIINIYHHHNISLSLALCLLDLPEKLAPAGTFDVLGYSHQLFHVGIIAGVVLEWAYFYYVQMKSQ